MLSSVFVNNWSGKCYLFFLVILAQMKISIWKSEIETLRLVRSNNTLYEKSL